MPYTDPPEAIADYQPWQLESPRGLMQTLTLSSLRPQGPGLVVKIKGYDDRDLAKTLVGSHIVVEREQLPALEEGHYWADLIGLQVLTLEGVDLGKVDYLIETGSNDVLVVKGERERLIPYRLKDVVVEVDLEKGILIVDWEPDF